MDRPPLRLDAGTWSRVKDLVVRAYELPLDRREAFIEAECGGDDGVLAEVSSLLDACVRAGDFLEELDAVAATRLLEASAYGLAPDTSVGPYRIIRPLGRGGMGIVYLAEDTRLRRAVALKFLQPHRSNDEAAKRRLLAEARAAAALDHPNIGVVHEIGETAAGQLFIAMTFYEGRTLDAIIADGPVPVELALSVGRQLALGLEAAHRSGITHRDVKPSNIVITPDGTVKLVDFGIASAGDTPDAEPDVTPGTLAYMSPEQAQGSPADARSDLWSLGVVLYEMLAGSRPFDAAGGSADTPGRREPPPLQQVRPDVPAGLAAVVERCLCWNAADRFADAGAVAAALDAVRPVPGAAPRRGRHRHSPTLRYAGMAMLLIVLAGAVAGGAEIGRRGAARSAVVSAQRVAVLPLTNAGAVPDDDYLADGLTEELISRLSRLGGLHVIARRSVLQYADSRSTAQQIGRELQVGSILEGSVHKDDGRLLVRLRLIDTRTDAEVWSESYDATLATATAVQRDIAEHVARALHVQLRAGTTMAGARPPDAAAYELFLKARHSLNRQSGAALRQAEELFTQALDIDPAYAPAWAGLAEVYALSGWYFAVAPEDGYPRARAAAERALELDPELAEAHATLAGTFGNYYRDWSRAERHYRKALELNPNHAAAHQLFAEQLHRLGRVDEALASALRARELDPLSAAIERTIGDVHYHARRFDDAVAQYRRVLTQYPEYVAIRSHMGLAHLAAGRPGQAVAAWEELLALRPDDAEAMALVGYGYAATGRSDDARSLLDEVERRAQDRYVSAFHRAALHAVLGNDDRAFALLHEAIDRREILVTYLGMDPVVFNRIRSDARYEGLLDRIGMGDSALAGTMSNDRP